MTLENVLKFRNKVIEKTYQIKNELYQIHGEQTSFYVAFAIFAYCDEVVNRLTLSDNSILADWHLLQEEAYGRNDGGDHIFEIIDKVMENPVFPEIISQVLYLIIAFGFTGCYLGKPSELEKYKNKLGAMIKPKRFEFHNEDTPNINKHQKKYKSKYDQFIFKTIITTTICFPIISYFGMYYI